MQSGDNAGDASATRAPLGAREANVRRLKAAFEKAAIGMVVKDAEGRVWESNRAFRRMLGYGEEEFEGMGRTDFTHPEDVAKDAELYARLLRGERGNFQLEKRYVKKDGGVAWGRLSISLIGSDAGDGGTFVLGVVEDVSERREAEEALRASEERFRTVVEQSPLSIHVFEPGGRSLRANSSWNELWNLEDGEEPQGHSIYEDEQLESTGLIPYIEESIAAGTAVRTPPLLHDPASTGREGDQKWLESSVYPVKDDSGVREMVLIIEDVSARHRAAEKVRRAEARFRAITEGAAVGIALTDLSVGRLVETNPALRRMLGYAEEELRSMSFADLTYPEDVGADNALFEELTRGERNSYLTEKRYVRRDGGVLWGRLTVSLVREERGEPRYVVGMVEDVTERKVLEERLRYQASYDLLTDLPNRSLFTDRLGQVLAGPGGRATVLVLNLDNFKHVNDSLGHAAGDQLLGAVARRLRAYARPGDTISRLGGDEFAILLADVDGEEEALQTAREISGQLEAPFRVGGRGVSAPASIGLSVSGAAENLATSHAAATRQAEVLLKKADAAMHEAKGRGKAQNVFYAEAMGKNAGKRLRLENDLRQAVKRDEFEVRYQPKVDLRTGRVVGAEALVRWRHPERGLVPPLDFIPLAEETGLIVPIGRRVLRAACEQARAWWDRQPGSDAGAARGTGAENPPVVWVNLSARQLREPDLVGEVSSILARTGLEPRGLGLEITESVLMQDGGVGTAGLEALKATGVMLAIDDFGTGYSSLSYLKRLPVDYLKVDRSFVSGLGRDPEDLAIVTAVVGLGRAMGLSVVAEGVETEEQLGCLQKLGCDIAQGYLFAEPLPGEEVPERVLAGRAE